MVLRPFLYLKKETALATSQLALLYPLCNVTWSEDRYLLRILGLVSSERRTPSEPDTGAERRFSLYPIVFYRQNPPEGGFVSVIPLYADLQGFLGYERVRMVLFPSYLHLAEPLSERNWVLFPFFGWSGGKLGRGLRVWPFYGWQEVGKETRFRYVLWPTYIRHERYPDRTEREVREVITPFYTKIDSPTQESRTYGLFFTHSIDRKENRQMWGFPWPLWIRETALDSGERHTIRIFPFYQNRTEGPFSSRFYLWPLYRTRSVQGEDHYWKRRDFLFVVGRHIEEFDSGHRLLRRLSTFFPLWRLSQKEEQVSQSLPALLDSLFPDNEVVRSLYAPLWQIYTRNGDDWSLLWQLMSFDGGRMQYPAEMELPWGPTE